MHLDIGQKAEDLRNVLQLRPVELEVLPRGEMAIALVKPLADQRQLPHLPRGERAIGNGDAQHIGVELEIEAILQAQRTELIIRKRAIQPPFHLIGKLGDPFAHEALVKFVIAIHGSRPCKFGLLAEVRAH